MHYIKAICMVTGAYVICKLLYNTAWDIAEKRMWKRYEKGGKK